MAWLRRGFIAALAAIGLAASGCGPQTNAAGGPAAGARELRIYNWSDYIDPQLLADFTRETGIRVTYATFESDEVMKNQVLVGGSGYDIVVPSNQTVAELVAAGAVQPLERARLSGWSNLSPPLMARLATFDPGNRHAMPYMWGTVGIGYNRAAVARALPGVNIDSWAVLFEPANLRRLQSCGVTFLDNAQDMFGPMLRFLGRDPNSTSLADYDAATARFMQLRPFVRRFTSSPISDLANGDICVAIGYSGDVLQARDRAAEAGRGVQIAYAIPREGSQIWFDSFTIPRDAPHAEAAHRFLDFMLRPAVIARASNFTHYANANAAATPMVAAATRDDPNVYVPQAAQANLFVVRPKAQDLLREVNRRWTRVTTGQ
jgi:putrescine transport system substrate-binding protein